MAVTTNFRYLVKDEDGLPMRQFYWKAEAQRFLLPGWVVVRLPNPVRSKIDLSQIEDAPF
jgi:hypothetical protein